MAKSAPPTIIAIIIPKTMPPTAPPKTPATMRRANDAEVGEPRYLTELPIVNIEMLPDRCCVVSQNWVVTSDATDTCESARDLSHTTAKDLF